MQRKLFLTMLPICFALLLAGVAIDSEVADRTGRTLVSHVLPEPQAKQVNAAVEEQIPIEELPETYWAWHLSLFVHDDWQQRPDEVALVTHFSADDRLVRLRRQVHDHLYTPANPMYKARYAKSIQNLPAVRLQEQDGKVIYQVGNSIAIPGTARKLGNDIARAIRERCPRPRPRPEPEPEPKPNPTPIPDMPIPDISPDDRAPDDEAVDEDGLSTAQIFGVGALLFVLSAGGAALIAAKKDALG